MDLLKVFDGIPYDVVVAKRHAYGVSKNLFNFISSYLKLIKRGEINDTENLLKISLAGMLRGLILRPIFLLLCDKAQNYKIRISITFFLVNVCLYGFLASIETRK